MGLVIPLNFFLRYVENVSIIITIISNITVLVSHNIICFGYFMSISRYVNKKAAPTQCALGSQGPLKNIIPSFLPSPHLNLQTVQAPLFREFTPQYIGFSCSPLKIEFFGELL